MAKYRVNALVTISMFTDVEADNEQEALMKADEQQMMGLCHYCASGKDSSKQWVTSGELDGDPEIQDTEII